MNLIAEAVGVRAEDISGPGWPSKDRYDIVADIPEGATKEQFNVMLKNLLRDRFHLRFHVESKIVPAYALRGGKNGPKFKVAVSHDDAKIPSERIDAQGFPASLPGFKGMVAFPTMARSFGWLRTSPSRTLHKCWSILAGSCARTIGRS
jgi:uncharacterized protein (TIGR03435 family)